MDWITSTEKKTISQIQNWIGGHLSHNELLTWSQNFYNTIDFEQEFENSRDRYRLRNLHTILYWYLASLDCRFIERKHGTTIIGGLEEYVNYFPLEFDTFEHSEYHHARQRAERLKEQPFYKKYSQLILSPNLEKACEDDVFLNVVFRKIFKYQIPIDNRLQDYSKKKYQSRISFGIELYLQKQKKQDSTFFFKGFNECTLIDKKRTNVYFPFEFEFNLSQKNCFMSLGEPHHPSEENKTKLKNSPHEPCPDKFEMKYDRLSRMLVDKHYTYLTKPKLKKNRFLKGFFGYWE